MFILREPFENPPVVMVEERINSGRDVPVVSPYIHNINSCTLHLG